MTYSELLEIYEKKRLPSEHFRKITSLTTYTWAELRFLPYGDGPDYGRSTLQYQLANPDEIEKRDCKLPTYHLSKKLQELGYETKILVKENFGTHPYLTIRVPDYQDMVVWVSFHPENVLCTWLCWDSTEVIHWGTELEVYAENNGYFVLDTNNGWDSLDQNFTIIDNNTMK